MAEFSTRIARAAKKETSRGGSNGRIELLATAAAKPDVHKIEIPDDSRSPFSETTNEWLISIMDRGETEKKESHRPKIEKVPRMLREMKDSKGSFDPLVVSIGPYHHGKNELLSMQNLKISIARQYVIDCALPIDTLYDEVARVARDAKVCYDEDSVKEISDEEFAKMMFLDACFVIQFIYCITNNIPIELKIKSQDVVFVQRDLFLLENQLPFLVLKTLMNFRFKGYRGQKLIEDFIQRGMRVPPSKLTCMERLASYIWPEKRILKPRKEGFLGDEPIHLLQLIRAQLVGDYDEDEYCYTHTDEWSSNLPAKELKMAGIHIKPSETACFNDVRFKASLFSGTLTLPRVTVDDFTRSLFLNLVAYESSPNAPDDFGVTSYICFMDSLLSQAKDVGELRSNGIILNLLANDQKVADLFSEMAHNLVPKPETYAHVQRNIQRHCDMLISRLTKWLHTQFSGHWAAIVFSGATFTIALTGLQTVLGVLQTYYAANNPEPGVQKY